MSVSFPLGCPLISHARRRADKLRAKVKENEIFSRDLGDLQLLAVVVDTLVVVVFTLVVVQTLVVVVACVSPLTQSRQLFNQLSIILLFPISHCFCFFFAIFSDFFYYFAPILKCIFIVYPLFHTSPLLAQTIGNALSLSVSLRISQIPLILQTELLNSFENLLVLKVVWLFQIYYEL